MRGEEDAVRLVFLASFDALIVDGVGTVAAAVVLGSGSAGVVVFFDAAFFVSVPRSAPVLAFGARVFFAGVALTSGASSLGATEAFETAFFVEGLALALAVVSLGAAALVFFTVSFIACAFLGLVVETWRAPWQRGVAIRLPIGATAGVARTQLLPHRDSIWALNPNRDILYFYSNVELSTRRCMGGGGAETTGRSVVSASSL